MLDIHETETETETENENWYLYYLICPKEKIVRYVGISKNPYNRLKRHLSDKSKTHKTHWIASLKTKNLLPELKIVVSNVSEEKAKKLEIKHGAELKKLYGPKLTNIPEALGGLPPIFFGAKNNFAKKRAFKVWNDQGREYIFNYQFEVGHYLGDKIKNGIYRVLNGKRKSIDGYYACYLSNIKNWRPRKNTNGKNNHFAKKNRFKIWNDLGEKYYFNYQFEAVKKLKLSQKHLSRVLLGKQKTISGYYACHISDLNKWVHPKDKRFGSTSNFAKYQPFVLTCVKTNQKYIFNYQFEAVQKLGLEESGLSQLLCKKLKTHKSYKGRFL